MKLKIYAVFFFTFLLIAFYFLKERHLDTSRIVKPVNQVSFQSSDNNDLDPILSLPGAEKKPVKTHESYVNTDLKQNKKNEEDPELDYITAYRDWQYFANCYTDVEDFHNEKDPLETLTERFANNSRESQTEPTPQQNLYYQQHVDICKALIDDEDDNYEQIIRKLQQRFIDITPKTDEEKQLAHSLQMVKQLQSFKSEFARSQFSRSSLTTTELNSINNQMQNLTTAMMQVYDGNEVLTPEQTQLINQYSEEIENLRLSIVNSKVIDNELISRAETQLDGYLNSMDDYLHRLQSPDAFLIIATEIYNAEYFQKESTVLKRLKAQTALFDSYYINILNNIALPLVACSMNYPCDAQSDLILSYCLGLKDSMFNQACGVSLEDFYFNFYIGTNQLNDVNNYFNYLVNRYAH
ncbi:MAG: hypothetical protein JKX98_02310 [Alcanivoracaceae bacterium]|nr:hypothetical protein [Alcanivoracaceae bacterium]